MRHTQVLGFAQASRSLARKPSTVIPPKKTAAASSRGRFTGFIANWVSGTHTYSACAPNLNNVPPNASSPGANRVTDLPTDSTVPANSIPPIRIFVGRSKPAKNRTTNGSAFLILQSAAETVDARTRTRTSLSLGVGLPTSLTWTTSGGPYLVMTAAFMRRSEPVFDLFPVAAAVVAGISADYTRPPPRKFTGGSICRMARTNDGAKSSPRRRGQGE